MRVAYLINQYPKVSHSFIRREIQALERAGFSIFRIAIRGWADPVVDVADEDERRRTRYVLQAGFPRLIGLAFSVIFSRPLRFLGALGLTLSMSRNSDRSVLRHFAYLIEACAVVRWLAESRTEHLHAHFGTNPADVAMLVGALSGITFSFTVHGPEEFDKPRAIGLREKSLRAAFVVAISSYGRSQLFRWLPLADWNKVHVVHCGLEPDFYGSVSFDNPIPARLVCVGRLSEQKGQLLLVQAVHRVLAKNIPLELVLAGDGEMRSEVEALIDELELRAHVRVTGWISSDQVREEILSARALVLPSFAEGLPVVIMEAMALRRPVISTFVAGIPELVQDGHTGWLVPAGDVAALSDALEACLATSPEALERMGNLAYARVVARHDVDREAEKLTSLFSQHDHS